jgi:hypothetical protein
MRTVRGGKVAIKTNDMLGPYFTTHKGVRQGNPFSPLLFNLVADGLACMIHKAQDEGLIEGLIPHIIQNGCCCLQYALFFSSKIVWKVPEILNSFCVCLKVCRG